MKRSGEAMSKEDEEKYDNEITPFTTQEVDIKKTYSGFAFNPFPLDC